MQAMIKFAKTTHTMAGLQSCNGVTGGWRRVANTHITTTNRVCPTGFRYMDNPPSCIPTRTSAGCTSVTYSVNNTPYSCITGRIVARQRGNPDGHISNKGIFSPYSCWAARICLSSEQLQLLDPMEPGLFILILGFLSTTLPSWESSGALLFCSGSWTASTSSSVKSADNNWCRQSWEA